MSRSKRTQLLWVAVGTVVGLLLRDPVVYLLWPNDSLDKEAGWLSFSADRSSRISWLLKLGADPNKLNQSRGYAPIHSAAHWGNIAVLRQLVAGGANVNLATAAGDTPLDLACPYSREAVPVLIELGAKSSSGKSECTLAN
jgi:ankyrin repeat protein